MTTAQKLMDALNLWVELSEVDPNQKSFTMSMGGGMDSYTVKKMHDLIKEALELDDSNTTGVLMLDALSKVYFDNRNFSISELLANPERTAQYVQKAGALREMVRSPEFMEQNRSFVHHLRSALRMYAMDKEETMALAENLHEIGYLRRDALRSIKNLRVDQFLSGEPEPANTQPVYHAWVHQFWNINSLVEAACSQPSGVTLSLIRDPNELQSYFAFAIRNGGNLFILSDVPVHAHPLQQYMSRKPGRAFGERTSQNWFPYDLLNLKFDEESETFFADAGRRRHLIPQQQKIDRLNPIGELKPQEVLWTIMMFDLIIEKFWHKGYQAKELSYTGAMIREERPLLDKAASANLPVVNYKTLNLPTLTSEDLTAEKVKEAVGSDGNNPNAWLEARYASQVDPELYNLIDSGANTFYLPPTDEFLRSRSRTHKAHELAVVTPSHVSVLTSDEKHLHDWDKEGRYTLRALPSTSFGTREELEHNRVFIARHNQAKAIQRLADKEFAARKDEVVEWFTTRVKKNVDYLLSLAAAGNVRRVFEPSGPGAELVSVDGYRFTGGVFNYVRTFDEDDTNLPNRSSMVSIHDGFYKSKYHCYVTGGVSSYRVYIQPQDAKDLAELAGCEVHELPDVLQHWCAKRNYRGNSNLDRIDPMAWSLRDPWCGLSFRVVLHLSKRAVAQLKKRFPEQAAQAVANPTRLSDEDAAEQARLYAKAFGPIPPRAVVAEDAGAD